MTHRQIRMPGGTDPGHPPAANVATRKVATRFAVHQQMAAQDRILGSGRRILAHVGLGPVDDTFIPDTDPDTAAANPDYPDTSTEYKVARLAEVTVTPGYMLRLDVLALPSGPCQYSPGSGWDPDGGMGQVILDVTYTNDAAQTVAVRRAIQIQSSPLQYAAKPSDDGMCWPVVEEHADVAIPADFDTDPATAAKWSGAGLTASIVISYLGSPRVLSAVVWEEPRASTVAVADTDWPAHYYVQGGDAHDAYPHTHAIEQDAQGACGQEWLAEAARQTAQQLGPMLAYWSAWDEASATIISLFASTSHGAANVNGVGDNEAPAVTITSSTFVYLLNTAWAYSADAPGWAIGCGAYGRLYRDDPDVMPTTGVVEVIVGVYGSAVGGSGGIVRITTTAYSYLEVAIPAGAYAWRYATGRLVCGTGPEDNVIAVPLVRIVSGATSVSVRAIGVWYARRPA